MAAQMVLEEGLADRIREAAQGRGVTPATVLHVVWARVLVAVAGQEDVVFGTVLLGRMSTETGADRMLGLFINTLPVRVDSRHVSVAEAVARMQEQLAGLLAHEHAPLALAQRASGVAAPAPLFTSILNYRHSQAPASAPPADSEESVLGGIDTLYARDRTNYPLSVAVDDIGTTLVIGVQSILPADPAYVCDLVQATATSLVEALETAPQTPLRSVAVLSAEQRRQLVSDWNNTPTEVTETTVWSALTPVTGGPRLTCWTEGWRWSRPGWPGTCTWLGPGWLRGTRAQRR